MTEVNPTGTGLVYWTYLGGTGSDQGAGIAVDSSGDAYVTGTAGANFPTTPGAYQTSYGGDTRTPLGPSSTPRASGSAATNSPQATTSSRQSGPRTAKQARRTVGFAITG